jgi:ATP adenylyltransferase
MTRPPRAEAAAGPEGHAPFLDRVRAVEEHARTTGALQPIATRTRVLERDGLRALVRILEHAERKALARQAQRAGRTPEDPFLPYEPDLFVQELGRDHVALLNKFQVLDHHVLIVTRHFEHQECPLTEADFAALWAVMRVAGGLGFYNAGAAAGASQRHKHLQWVPTPLDPADSGEVPIESLFGSAGPRSGRVTALRFPHALRAVPESVRTGRAGAGDLRERYQEMLEQLGLQTKADGHLPPYNLLMTRRWMMLVPRSREHWRGISINALGFAGAFLVHTDEEYDALATTGPLAVLHAVAKIPVDDG